MPPAPRPGSAMGLSGGGGGVLGPRKSREMLGGGMGFGEGEGKGKAVIRIVDGKREGSEDEEEGWEEMRARREVKRSVWRGKRRGEGEGDKGFDGLVVEGER